MLRIVFLAVGIAASSPAISLAETNLPVADEQTIQTRLWRVLQLDDLMPIMRDEAVAEAKSMQDLIVQRGGDDRWIQIVERNHEPARLERLFHSGVKKSDFSEHPALIDSALIFYETPLGRRMLSLETSARRVMLDDDAKTDARGSFSEAASTNSPRIAQIRRLIDQADLIGPNVAGGMNAALAFARGYDEGGGYTTPMSEAEMLSETWAQELMIRAEALGWLEAYLYLAYSPLSDAELDQYIDFAASPSGQALADVLFAGFDAMFEQTSYEMGLAAAGQIQGHRL